MNVFLALDLHMFRSFIVLVANSEGWLIHLWMSLWRSLQWSSFLLVFLLQCKIMHNHLLTHIPGAFSWCPGRGAIHIFLYQSRKSLNDVLHLLINILFKFAELFLANILQDTTLQPHNLFLGLIHLHPLKAVVAPPTVLDFVHQNLNFHVHFSSYFLTHILN